MIYQDLNKYKEQGIELVNKLTIFRSILYNQMSLQNKFLLPTSIKEEYLPPPLEKNLSLFDIQVKMTKQFIPGTEQQKDAIVKKRIKKFFDYGNTNQDQPTFSPLQKKIKPSTPCDIDRSNLKDGLKIECSKIILYDQQSITYEIAQKLFPGFIGFQRIDDCNIKLSFSNKQECQKLLIQNSKDPSSILAQHIKNPYEIQWFQLIHEVNNENKQMKKYYARYVTNKDNILLGSDNYFRKLLGKARILIDQKQEQTSIRQKEIQLTTQFNKSKIERRKPFKNGLKYKKYGKDFDTETNYDGLYFPQKSVNFQFSGEPFPIKSKNYVRSFDQRDEYQKDIHFGNLNISAIKPNFIDLQNQSYDKTSRNKDEGRLRYKNFSDKSEGQRSDRNLGLSKDCLREKLIRQFRERQFGDVKTNGKLIKSSECQTIQVSKRKR